MYFNIDVSSSGRMYPFRRFFFIGTILLRNFRCYHFELHKRRGEVRLKQAVTKYPQSLSICMQSDNQMYLKINVAEAEIKFQATVQDNSFKIMLFLK